MRVAIPSDNGINIAAHTGRAQGFLVYDCEDNKAVRVEYRTNSYTPHAKGECTGEGNHAHDHGHDQPHAHEHEHNHDHAHEHHHHHDHSHADLLGALHDCQVMIAHGMGPRLVMDLQRRNIRVVFCEGDNAERAASDYATGKLVSTGKSCCDHQGC